MMHIPKHIQSLVTEFAANLPVDAKRDYFRLHRYRFEALLAAVPPGPAGRRALEIGMNPGLCTELLVRAGYTVSGTDLFPEHRAELWQRLGVDARRWNIDNQECPYSLESFDLIFFSEVIEHLANPPVDALADIGSRLVPGGYLIITTPNQFYLKSRMRTLADIVLARPFDHDEEFHKWANLKSEARYYTHSRLFTMKQLHWMAEQAGLRVTTMAFCDPWERVGLEPERIVRHPLRWGTKAAISLATRAMPAARSMLLLVAQRP
jgi:2-polyprenyl-3-methyl-5-hydroxy-6-metoxy-1,4-benzoquinol methylase